MAGRRRGRYPPEYKERIVELVRAGRSPGSLAREFEPSEQTIRNWVARYEAGGLAALKDKRVAGPSPRRASPEEVAALEALYRDGCAGWNVLHFYHEVYAGEHGGARSYTWVKSRLQEAGLVRKGRRKGAHRLRRERKPAEGMMLHQDASTHEWAPGQGWDLVVTMDDATSGVYSGFFVEEEGTWSSLRGVAETVKVQGLFDSLYTDRGSHYWHTPQAGGKVDKDKPTQFGRAMGELGIEMIAAYSPQARGRSERLFGTLQGRLPQELARAGITDMDEANEFLKDFWPRFNAAFAVEAVEAKRAFSPVAAADEGQAARHPLPVGDTDGWQRQLRDLQGQDPADPASAAPVHLRASQGQGPRIRGRRHGRLPRHPEARALRCERQVAGHRQRVGGGSVRRYRRPLGSLRSPRRAAVRKSGHFMCYGNRTFHLLPTRLGDIVAPCPKALTAWCSGRSDRRCARTNGFPGRGRVGVPGP